MKTGKQLMSEAIERHRLEYKTIRVFFDGACEPRNPGGVATCGWIIYGIGDKVVDQGSLVVCEGEGATNNVAEYHALGRALRRLVDFHDVLIQLDQVDQINIFGDSRLVCEQVGGNWRCNKEHLRKLRDRCRELIDKLRQHCDVALRWVPREENQEADDLSRRAYEEHTGKNFPVRSR